MPNKKDTKEIRRLQKTVRLIESLKPSMERLSEEEMKRKTADWKQQLKEGKITTKALLPEAFALVREATRRVYQREHYPVQLMGGIVLFQGRIAEMKTGEGKTQTCYLPAYLKALEGKGVHIVTVNDYLAHRDAEEAGQVMEYLGLTVGCVLQQMSPEERKEAYQCDITYVTNSELGFDYLKDNMVKDLNDRVLRGLHYAIIDEVDSILIDEARTPLIISGQGTDNSDLYGICNSYTMFLQKGEKTEVSKMDLLSGIRPQETGDFVVDEKEKEVHLTEQGIRRLEEMMSIDNLAAEENRDLMHGLTMALRARYLMQRDVDYLVRDDQIWIIDPFTGRIMPGRRFSDGLHQALEAKEGVSVKTENLTMATITFQTFFNKFEKKAGMTGTAKTEEQEFIEIYGMDVVEIPTNRPVIRTDLEDRVYKTKEEKYRAVIREIREANEKGQPVLVGTVSVEVSEHLSSLLKNEQIPHTVLNAKYHEMEAHIIEHAGEYGAVTIATNMAGRGTDIKLDDRARKAGGLKVIGTERHEARRIDNQLIGRSGRQGDPGESRFCLSLEDDLLRLFGSETAIKMMEALDMEENEAIEYAPLSKVIRSAQRQMEQNHYGIRKRLLDYDLIYDEQRSFIYEQRELILRQGSTTDLIRHALEQTAANYVQTWLEENDGYAEADYLNRLYGMFEPFLAVEPLSVHGRRLNPQVVVKEVTTQLLSAYDGYCKTAADRDLLTRAERHILLSDLDGFWKVYIDEIEHLKDGVGLMQYGQKDPVTEFRVYSSQMFETMMASIYESITKHWFYYVPRILEENAA